MHIRELMTTDPVCCAPETSLQDAAKLMADMDCGEIPVIDEQRRPVGVVTDRDISCRGVAQGRDLQTPVSEVMSTPAIAIKLESELDDCLIVLEANDIRRVPVVDQNGACCGMVSQADIARHAPEHETAEFIRDVSQPSPQPSHAS